VTAAVKDLTAGDLKVCYPFKNVREKATQDGVCRDRRIRSQMALLSDYKWGASLASIAAIRTRAKARPPKANRALPMLWERPIVSWWAVEDSNLRPTD
jgi:hypothetical protein